MGYTHLCVGVNEEAETVNQTYTYIYNTPLQNIYLCTCMIFYYAFFFFGEGEEGPHSVQPKKNAWGGGGLRCDTGGQKSDAR